MLGIASILFIIFPIISLPIILLLYFFDTKSKGILYSALIGLIFGIMVYHYIPFNNYDLYRHHLLVSSLTGKDLSYFIMFVKNTSFELLPSLIIYIASRFNNPNLIQFIIVSLGYGILLYMLYDYRKISKANTFVFITITVFTLFGFNTLYFISGLWFYISVILFSFTYYLEDVKHKNKILCYILYFVSILFHNATLFAIAVLLIYRLMKGKLTFKTILIAVLIFTLPALVLELLNNWFNVKIFKSILDMYNAYLGNERMNAYYHGRVLIIEATKLFITLAAIFLQKERKKGEGINGFVILLSICTIVMLPKSIVMIRFVMPIQFLGIIALFDYLKKVGKSQFVFIICLLFLNAFYIDYFHDRMFYQNFGNLFTDGYYQNLFTLLKNNY